MRILSDSLKRTLLKPTLRLARNLFSAKIDYRQLRAAVARLEGRFGDDISDVRQTNIALPQCTATWFDVADARQDHVILYIHGGAFVLETPRLHGGLLARLCRATAMRGFMLNYRLAPEFPYPAAPEDCLDAYRYLVNKGYAAEKIIIAGDSAGGNLALVTLLRIRDDGLPLPAGAIALSPLTDGTLGSDSIERNDGHDLMFARSAFHNLAPHYMPQAERRGEFFASPVLADLSGLPPIFLLVGSSELLLDDSIRFACKCPSARVEVWHDMPHVFPLFSFLPEAREALKRMAQFAGTVLAAAAAAANTPGDVKPLSSAQVPAAVMANAPANERIVDRQAHARGSAAWATVYLLLALAGLFTFHGGLISADVLPHWFPGLPTSMSMEWSQGGVAIVLLTLLVLTLREGLRLSMPRLWLPIVITLLFGAVCGLPFFFYLRERQLLKQAS